jgi:hypothetical protein
MKTVSRVVLSQNIRQYVAIPERSMVLGIGVTHNGSPVIYYLGRDDTEKKLRDVVLLRVGYSLPKLKDKNVHWQYVGEIKELETFIFSVGKKQ